MAKRGRRGGVGGRRTRNRLGGKHIVNHRGIHHNRRHHHGGGSADCCESDCDCC